MGEALTAEANIALPIIAEESKSPRLPVLENLNDYEKINIEKTIEMNLSSDIKANNSSSPSQ